MAVSFMLIHFQVTARTTNTSMAQVIYRRARDGKVWRRDWNTSWPAELVCPITQPQDDEVNIGVASKGKLPQAILPIRTHDGEHLIMPTEPATGLYAEQIERATEMLAEEVGRGEHAEPIDESEPNDGAEISMSEALSGEPKDGLDGGAS